MKVRRADVSKMIIVLEVLRHIGLLVEDSVMLQLER